MSPKTLYLVSAILLINGLFGTQVQARRSIYDHPHETQREYEGDTWEEEHTELPDYPREEDLLEVHVDDPRAKFRYFIDTESLYVGESDGVVRYTLVIRSTTGATNVMFEAMSCTKRQYKTFAYGTRDGKFRPMRTPRWRPIKLVGNALYHKDLWEFYLCDFDTRRTRPRDRIIDAIRYYREDRKDKGF